MAFDFAGKAAEVERLLRDLVAALVAFKGAKDARRTIESMGRMKPCFDAIREVLFGHYRVDAKQPHHLNLDQLKWPSDLAAEHAMIRGVSDLPPFALGGRVVQFDSDSIGWYVAQNLIPLENLLFALDAARADGPPAAANGAPQAGESPTQDLVTMEFGARLVHRKVGTLKNQGDLPTPTRPSVGNKPAEYTYDVMRRFLLASFPDEIVPEKFSDAIAALDQTV